MLAQISAPTTLPSNSRSRIHCPEPSHTETDSNDQTAIHRLHLLKWPTDSRRPPKVSDKGLDRKVIGGSPYLGSSLHRSLSFALRVSSFFLSSSILFCNFFFRGSNSASAISLPKEPFGAFIISFSASWIAPCNKILSRSPSRLISRHFSLYSFSEDDCGQHNYPRQSNSVKCSVMIIGPGYGMEEGITHERGRGRRKDTYDRCSRSRSNAPVPLSKRVHQHNHGLRDSHIRGLVDETTCC